MGDTARETLLDYRTLEDAPSTNTPTKLTGSPMFGRRHSFPPTTGDQRSSLPGYLFAAPEDMAAVLEDSFDINAKDPHATSIGFLKAGGLPAAVYTLCSISLGVGVFVLPAVLKDIGVLPGVGALIVFGVWAYWSQMVLVKASMSAKPPITSYEDLAALAFGTLGKFVLAFFTAFTLLVGNAGHMKAVAQLLHDILEWYVTGEYGHVHQTTAKELVIYVALLSVALMFCTGHRISNLRYVSTLSVSVVLVLCVWCTGECLFWYWPQGHHHFTGKNAPLMASSNWKDYASNLPAVAFTYSGTFCLFPVINEMRDKSLKNIHRAVYVSSLMCCGGYLLVAVVGIFTFGRNIGYSEYTHKTASNYLYVFPPSHLVVTFLCFVLTITITLLYPVVNFPMLNALEKIISIFPVPSCLDFRQQFLAYSHHRLILTVLGMIAVVCLNLVFNDLVALFGFCGGWGVGFVVYIIPCAIYIKLCPEEPIIMRLVAFVSILAMLGVAVLFTMTTKF